MPHKFHLYLIDILNRFLFNYLGFVLYKLYSEDIFLCLIWLTRLRSCSYQYTCYGLPYETTNKSYFLDLPFAVELKKQSSRFGGKFAEEFGV